MRRPLHACARILGPSIAAVIASACATPAPRVEVRDASAADTTVVRLALESLSPETRSRFAFVERPLWNDQASPCSTHSRPHLPAIVALARKLLPSTARAGYRLMLSHVRDSAGVKVIDVLTGIDSVSAEYGSASVSKILVDRRGERVLSHRIVMGETVARSQPRDPVHARVSGEFLAAAVLATGDSARRPYFAFDSASVSALPGVDSATYGELRVALAGAGTIGVPGRLPQCAPGSGRACARVTVGMYSPGAGGADVDIVTRPASGGDSYSRHYVRVGRRPDGRLSASVEFSTDGHCAR